MAYIPRIIDVEIQDRLTSIGAVVIEGPKACGKTESGRRHAASEVLLDTDTQAQAAIDVDPRLVLEGDKPRLIDEWQTRSELWNHVRRWIDDSGERGQFILTGSSVPADDIIRHSGAGRLTRIRMRPLSLFETGHSSGEVSLREMFQGIPPSASVRPLSVTDLAELIAVGGWPATVGMKVETRMRYVRDYLEEIRRVDVGRVDDTFRDPQKVGALLHSLARNTASDTSMARIRRDISGAGASISGAGASISDLTLARYYSALERLMIVEDLPAWSGNIRSGVRVGTRVKRHFVDPSLAVAALGNSPTRLLTDMETTGFLFESLVVRDLRVYGQSIGARLFHFKSNNNVDVDVILEMPDGRWIGFEVKLGKGRINDAAKSLVRFRKRLKENNQLAMLAVIVGNAEYSYVRGEDGIAVIPFGALGP